MTNEAQRNEDTVEPLVRQIIAILYEHENDLSDGFGYYGGDSGVERTAKDIAALMPNTEITHVGSTSEGG